jgi:hypothetical protein
MKTFNRKKKRRINQERKEVKTYRFQRAPAKARTRSYLCEYYKLLQNLGP